MVCSYGASILAGMASRSRWVALGLSTAAVAGLTAGMAATAEPQKPPPQPVAADPEVATSLPGAAEPADNPFAGQVSITQTGAS